ncbi:hypothetical protein C4G54_RS01145 [Vibrio parahaemolyticus]|nr:hypothetical protein [Vibrio parahaemolyticus]
MVIPTKITSGLSVNFTLSYPDYPASSWVATIYLRSASGKADIVGTPEGDAFRFSVSASETANWPAEEYSVVLRVTDGTDVHQPLTSRLTVLPDLAALDVHDPRSEAEKALAAIQATLTNRATSDQLKLSFGGRSLEKTPLSELLQLEQRFLNRVNQEKRKKSGRGLLTVHKVRMR